MYRELNGVIIMLSDAGRLECVSTALTDWFLCRAYRELNGVIIMLSDTGCLECVYPRPSLTGFCAMRTGS